MHCIRSAAETFSLLSRIYPVNLSKRLTRLFQCFLTIPNENVAGGERANNIDVVNANKSLLKSNIVIAQREDKFGISVLLRANLL